MGVDADAYVYFGFPLDEEHVFDDEAVDRDIDSEDDWDDVYARKKGLLTPSGEYTNETREAFTEYWRSKSALIEDLKVTIGRSGNAEYPRYYVCAKESLITAWYGDHKKILTIDLAIDARWHEQIREFTTLMGIPHEEPSWYLTNLLST